MAALVRTSDRRAALLACVALKITDSSQLDVLTQCFAEYRHGIAQAILLEAAKLSRAKNHVQSKALGDLGCRISNGEFETFSGDVPDVVSD